MSGRMSSSKSITASQLIHRITIQELTISTNVNGFAEEVWTDIYTVWASKSNIDGREYWSAKAVQGENTVEFDIRYAQFVNGLDSRKNRIRHGKKTINIFDDSGEVTGTQEVDRVYNITFIDNVDFQNQFIRIKTLEALP